MKLKKVLALILSASLLAAAFRRLRRRWRKPDQQRGKRVLRDRNQRNRRRGRHPRGARRAHPAHFRRRRGTGCLDQLQRHHRGRCQRDRRRAKDGRDDRRPHQLDPCCPERASGKIWHPALFRYLSGYCISRFPVLSGWRGRRHRRWCYLPRPRHLDPHLYAQLHGLPESSEEARKEATSDNGKMQVIKCIVGQDFTAESEGTYQGLAYRRTFLTAWALKSPPLWKSGTTPWWLPKSPASSILYDRHQRRPPMSLAWAWAGMPAKAPTSRWMATPWLALPCKMAGEYLETMKQWYSEGLIDPNSPPLITTWTPLLLWKQTSTCCIATCFPLSPATATTI